MDRVNKQTRSKMMSAVRSKNTKLEIDIRRCLFAHGFRYRLHVRSLAGTPDIVFPKYSAVVFIHGCFWHSHMCSRFSLPENRKDWWQRKLEGNKARDAMALADLRRNGWRVLIVWECSIRGAGINREEALDLVCTHAGKFLRSKKFFHEISGPLIKDIPDIKKA
jgi:DNA mismatch endonuclease (patch repair protein)